MTLKELCEAHEKAIKTKTDVGEEVQETTNKLKQIIDRLILPEVEDREHETNGIFVTLCQKTSFSVRYYREIFPSPNSA